MIVRAIVKPEYTEQVFQQFDYFNDFDNTLAFVRSISVDAKPEDAGRYRDIIERLERGNKEFQEKYWSEIKKKAGR